MSLYIENLAKPHVLHKDLSVVYQEIAVDEQREKEADTWCEEIIRDINDAER